MKLNPFQKNAGDDGDVLSNAMQMSEFGRALTAAIKPKSEVVGNQQKQVFGFASNDNGSEIFLPAEWKNRVEDVALAGLVVICEAAGVRVVWNAKEDFPSNNQVKISQIGTSDTSTQEFWTGFYSTLREMTKMNWPADGVKFNASDHRNVGRLCGQYELLRLLSRELDMPMERLSRRVPFEIISVASGSNQVRLNQIEHRSINTYGTLGRDYISAVRLILSALYAGDEYFLKRIRGSVDLNKFTFTFTEIREAALPHRNTERTVTKIVRGRKILEKIVQREVDAPKQAKAISGLKQCEYPLIDEYIVGAVSSAMLEAELEKLNSSFDYGVTGYAKDIKTFIKRCRKVFDERKTRVSNVQRKVKPRLTDLAGRDIKEKVKSWNDMKKASHPKTQNFFCMSDALDEHYNTDFLFYPIQFIDEFRDQVFYTVREYTSQPDRCARFPKLYEAVLGYNREYQQYIAASGEAPPDE